jgi:RND family efflux transporter MFP subunit
MDTQSSNSPNGFSPQSPHTNPTQFRTILLGAGALMAVLLAIGIVPRLQRHAELDANAKEAKADGLTVNTVTPHPASAKTLALPGSVEGLQEVTIYARTNGYLAQRLADIGDRVEAGQLLAEIDSPETDRELDQARASLAQTRSAYMQSRANLEQARAALVQNQTNANFARVSSNRWQQLQHQGAVSQQAFDEKQAAYDANRANVKAAESVIAANQASVESASANIQASEANVRRLEAMAAYKHITAPFSGVVTARNVDMGALISAGSGGNNAVWLYKIAQPSSLRIFVNVPQSEIASIRPGQLVTITVRELPKQVFKGKVVRTARALDVTARTLRTEIEIANPGSKLLPGMFAQVQFTLNQMNSPLVVPANAIISRSEGTLVAVVQDGKVHFQRVAIGRDYGTEVEILSGLQGGEQLAVNLTDAVVEGAKVKAVPVKNKPEA